MSADKSRHNVVSIRLSDDEIAALRQFPGSRDSERLRSAIQSRSIGTVISEPIVRELSRMHQQMQSLKKEVEDQGHELRSMRERLDREPVVLPESVESNLEKITDKISKLFMSLKALNQKIQK